MMSCHLVYTSDLMELNRFVPHMKQQGNRFEEAGRDSEQIGISGRGHDDRSVGEEVWSW